MKKLYIFILINMNFILINCMIRHQYYTKEEINNKREEVKEMFHHAYSGYLKYANGYDELRPLTCDGQNTWGSYSLTLIDGLDTLVIMGNYSEFRRVVQYLVDNSKFDADINVSVFETNIRIVGGLLSAHLFSRKAGLDLEPGWPCNGPLLRMAEDVARRLLPAFDTKTGMPFGTVNLRYGVPAGETSITCTAGVGTFLVEFGALSRLTGDPIYEEVALNAVYSLWNHRSPIGLFGNHIDVQTGRWTAQDAGIGAGVDSFFEYLVKGAIMLNRPDLMKMFHESRAAIDKYLKKEDWYIWASMNKGQVTLPIFQSLEAFWPGVLTLIGDIEPAMKTFTKYHGVWKQYGFLPEFYNIPNLEATRETYPLRPELIESAMLLYRATKDPYFLEVGDDMLTSIQHSCRTTCGYATIRNVRNHERDNRMESFFLAETTKYMYLLFDSENFIHNDGSEGIVLETSNGACIIEAGNYIFNTEAHPIDPSALHCCTPVKEMFSNFDYNDYRGEILDLQQRKLLIEKRKNQRPKCPEIKPRSANITIDIEFEIVESVGNISTSEKFKKQMKEEKRWNSDRVDVNIWKVLETALTKKFTEERQDPVQTQHFSEVLKTVMESIEIDKFLSEKHPLFNLTTILKLDRLKNQNLYELYLIKLKTSLETNVLVALDLYRIRKKEEGLKINYSDFLNLLSEILSNENFIQNFLSTQKETTSNDDELSMTNQISFTKISSDLTDEDAKNEEITKQSYADNFIEKTVKKPSEDINLLANNEKNKNAEEVLKLSFPTHFNQIVLDFITILWKNQILYEISLENSTEIYQFILEYVANQDGTDEDSKATFEILKILKTIELNRSDNLENFKLNPKLFYGLLHILEFKKKISETFEKFKTLKESLRHESEENTVIEQKQENFKLGDDSEKDNMSPSTSKIIESNKKIVKNEKNLKNDDDELVVVNEDEVETGVGTIEPLLDSDRFDPKNDDLIKNFAKSEKNKNLENQPITEPTPPNIKYLEDTENSSILTDFVQSILKVSHTRPEKKFDPQTLLERIRKNSSYMIYDENWEIFSCKAPTFMQKMFVNGLL